MASTNIINNNTTAINFSIIYSLTNNNYNNFPAKFHYLKHTSIYYNYNYKSQQLFTITTIIPLATTNQSSESESLLSDDNDNDDDGIIEVEIEKISKNRRRIQSTVRVDASLERVWGILTDYERLAEFIPSLVVSQVLDKQPSFARLLQIGQQNLAFGLKFNAKGVVDCYEKDFESLPNGQRRDIEFKMIEGDFELFEGKWSIEKVILDGTNYNDWMRNIKMALRFEDKEYVLDKELGEIDEEKATPEELAAYKKHYVDATKVSCIMVATMTSKLQKFYEDYWPYEMNKDLIEKYHKRARQKKYEIVKSLISSKMKDGESVSGHVQRMQRYVDPLVKLNVHIDEELAIDIVLNSLPSCYDQFILTYHLKNNETTLSQLHNLPRTAETGMKCSIVID